MVADEYCPNRDPACFSDKSDLSRHARLRWRRSRNHGGGTFHESALPDMSPGARVLDAFAAVLDTRRARRRCRRSPKTGDANRLGHPPPFLFLGS
jgi:hypothetical protein